MTGKQLHDDLERGQTYADMEKIDLIIGRNVESESFDQYMSRSEGNIQEINSIEASKPLDDTEIQQIFHKTHIFAPQTSTVSGLEETKRDEDLHLFYTPYPEVDFTNETLAKVRPLDLTDESEAAFVTPSDEALDKDPSMARDYLEATSVSADTSSLTQQGQEIAKIDTWAIL